MMQAFSRPLGLQEAAHAGHWLQDEASSPKDPGEAAAARAAVPACLCSKVGKCWSCRGSIYSKHTSNHLVLFLASA